MHSQGMKFTRLVSRFMALFFAVALLAAPAAYAQYGTPAKQQPAPKPAPGDKAGAPAEPATPPVNKAEEDAARAFFALKQQDSAQVITLGEDFLEKYPASRYRDSVYARLAHSYQTAGKMDKMFSTGDRALKEDPNNVDVISLIAYYMYGRYHSNALDAEQTLQKMEQYARHGLELIAAMQKPENITEEDFTRTKNTESAMCHSGLGKYYYFEGRDAQMVEEFQKSTSLDPTPDPLDFFLLGSGAVRLKKYSDAAAAFERCSATPWSWQDQCKSKLAQVKPLAAAQAAAAPAPAQPAAAPAQPAPATQPDKPKPPRS